MHSAMYLSAEDHVWNNSGTGAWSNSANWTGGGLITLPRALVDTARIDQGTATITAGTVAEYGELRLGFTPGLTGTVTMTGGTMTGIDFTVGRLGGEGVFNMSAGTASNTILRVGDGAPSSKGAVNYSGTAVHNVGELHISGATATGVVNLAGSATLRVQDLAIIDTSSGNGTFRQTGGSFVLQAAAGSSPLGDHGLYIGRSLDHGGISGGVAQYEMTGGTMNAYYDVYLGYSPPPGPELARTSAIWNISGGASANIRGATAASPGGYFAGNLNLGYYGTTPAVLSTPTDHYSRTEVNVFDGSLYVQGSVIGWGKDNHFNIYGSKASVDIGAFNAGFGGLPGSDTFEIAFTLDKGGISKLNVRGAANFNMVNNKMVVKIPAFLALQVPEFDLIQAGSIAPNILDRINNQTPYRVETTLLMGTTVKLGLEVQPYQMWDMDNLLFMGVNTIGDGQKGALYATGSESYPLIVEFEKWNGMTLSTEPVGSLIGALKNYLNEAMVDTGVTFQLHSSNSLLMTGDYLNLNGEVWFGWDLSDFFGDECCCDEIRLKSFRRDERDVDVPEPSTWMLLMLGGAAMFYMRKKVLA